MNFIVPRLWLYHWTRAKKLLNSHFCNFVFILWYVFVPHHGFTWCNLYVVKILISLESREQCLPIMKRNIHHLNFVIFELSNCYAANSRFLLTLEGPLFHIQRPYTKYTRNIGCIIFFPSEVTKDFLERSEFILSIICVCIKIRVFISITITRFYRNWYLFNYLRVNRLILHYPMNLVIAFSSVSMVLL